MSVDPAIQSHVELHISERMFKDGYAELRMSIGPTPEYTM